MNVLIWNCRGVAGAGFTSLVKDLANRYSACLIFLLETHVSGEKAKRLIKKFNFDGTFIVDGVGFSGGIWCMWKMSNWVVDVINFERQFVHLKIAYNQNPPWHLTIVYGSPQPAMRRDLWAGLRNIATQVSGDWCVGGDFNSVLSVNDTGGNSNLSCDSGIFNKCLFDCGLNDVGFKGQPFTWQRSNIRRRLDRFVANQSWSCRFGEACVRHLPKLKSDHIPLLLDFGRANNLQMGEKPFRFLAPWLIHGDFKDMLEGAWLKDGIMEENIHSFVEVAKEWNKNVFGNIMRHKNRLLLRLEGISKKLSFQENKFLEKLQRDLWKEYEGCLVQEEIY